MKLARPVFDPSKFMQVRCGRRDVEALRQALGKLEQALERRSRRARRFFWGLTAALALFAVLQLLAGEALAPAGAMAVAALAYAYAATLLVSLFQRREGGAAQRLPIVVKLFLLVNPGVFLYMGAYALWQGQAAALDPRARPAPFALGLAASVAAVVWVRRIASWGRIARVQPQRLEVDYLARIAGALLGDLPSGTTASLTFNPFRSEWSRQKLELPRQRPGYTFDAGADILLALKLPVDDRTTFRLSVVEYSVHKTKNRKQKYKGTKRRVVYRCDLSLAAGPGQAPAGAAARDLSGALVQHLGAAGSRWNPATEAAGDFFEGLAEFVLPSPDRLRVRAEARPDRVSATLVLKSGGTQRELAPGHLLPPSLVLAAVQFLGGAAAA